MYNCIGHSDLLKNSNSLKVQNHENSMENQRTYQTMKIQWKIVYIRCTESSICWEIWYRWMYKSWKSREKLGTLEI